MLEVSNLTAIRDDRVLFENLQFEIKPGELVQIEGRNGTGKTTLLRIVTGLGDREEGTIKWKGEEVEKSRDVFHQDGQKFGGTPAQSHCPVVGHRRLCQS